jgi:acyl carrier protein
LIIYARRKSAAVLTTLDSVPMTMYSTTQLVSWVIFMNKSVEDVVVEEIRKHAVSNKLNRDTLLTTSLKELGIDSLSMLEVVMNVEENYDIRIDESALDKCVTLKDVVALVTKTISAMNSSTT